MPRDRRHSLGRRGEELACAELRRRGYEVFQRRYRTRYGEIDIVARHGQTIVFVEVKSRAGRAFGGGAVAVTVWKQRRIAQTAADFLVRRRLGDCPCRFDVVTVDFADGRSQIEVYPHAFSAI